MRGAEERFPESHKTVNQPRPRGPRVLKLEAKNNQPSDNPAYSLHLYCSSQEY